MGVGREWKGEKVTKNKVGKKKDVRKDRLEGGKGRKKRMTRARGREGGCIRRTAEMQTGSDRSKASLKLCEHTFLSVFLAL